MKNNLLNILYNPGSINTCVESDTVYIETNHQGNENFNDTDFALLQSLEEGVLAPDEYKIHEKLEKFCRQLSYKMSPRLVPVIMKEFNTFLQRISLKYSTSKEIFNQCLQITIQFKNQIDSQQPGFGLVGKLEWVELERSLFFLTQWEYKLGIRQDEMVLYQE